MSGNNSPLLNAVMEHVIGFLPPVDAFALSEVFDGCRQFLYRSLNNSLAAVLDRGNTVFRTGLDPLQSFSSLAKSLPPRSVCIGCVQTSLRIICLYRATESCVGRCSLPCALSNNKKKKKIEQHLN